MDDLVVGRSYGLRVDAVSSDEAAACARLMGEPLDARVPLGMAFVLALRALIAAGFLPGGAIMAGHRVTWLRRPVIGEHLETDVSLLALERTRGRLLIGYETRDRDGQLLIRQEQDVRWPRVA